MTTVTKMMKMLMKILKILRKGGRFDVERRGRERQTLVERQLVGMDEHGGVAEQVRREEQEVRESLQHLHPGVGKHPKRGKYTRFGLGRAREASRGRGAPAGGGWG